MESVCERAGWWKVEVGRPIRAGRGGAEGHSGAEGYGGAEGHGGAEGLPCGAVGDTELSACLMLTPA